MEGFITRKEFEEVLKDLKKLRTFLSDTFGAKFLDFMKEDEKLPDDNNKEQIAVTEISSTLSSHQPQNPLILQPSHEVTSRISPSSPLASCGISKSLPLSRTSSEKDLTPDVIILNSDQDEPTESQSISTKTARERIVAVKRTSVGPKKTSSTSSESNGVVPIKILPSAVPSTLLSSFKTKRSLKLNDATDSGHSKRQKSTPKSTLSAPREGADITQCDECQLFIFSNQFESHKRNHALYDARKVEKSSSLLRQEFQCPVCQEKCKDFDRYEEHLSEAHPNLQGKPCPICSKVLSMKSRLKRHLLVHDELKFCCKICGKGYNRSDNLIAHYKTHENNQELHYFYCSVCNNAFASRDGRDRHMATAHKNPADVARGKDKDQIGGNVLDNDESRSQQQQNLGQPMPTTSVSEIESQPISLSTAVVEKIKVDCVNLSDFVYEGDDD